MCVGPPLYFFSLSLSNDLPQAMRSSSSSTPTAAHAPKRPKTAKAAAEGEEEVKTKRERSKSVNTVAARMKQVVERMIQAQRAGEPHAQLTVFVYKSPQSEIINAFFSELQRENPTLFRRRDDVLALIAERYDEFLTLGWRPQT